MRQPMVLGIIVVLMGLALIAVLIIVPRFASQGGAQVRSDLNPTQRLILEHPINGQVLAAWCSGTPIVTDVIGDTWQLKTHPDLVDQFYEVGQANASPDVNVKWVVCGRPGLVNPNTGIIYGLATGTSGFYLRFPGNGGDKSEYGPGWTSVDPWSNDVASQCAAAYAASAETT